MLSRFIWGFVEVQIFHVGVGLLLVVVPGSAATFGCVQDHGQILARIAEGVVLAILPVTVALPRQSQFIVVVVMVFGDRVCNSATLARLVRFRGFLVGTRQFEHVWIDFDQRHCQ